MIKNSELSPAEKLTMPDTGEMSRDGSALLSAVIFQKTDTAPKVPLSRKTSKLALSVLTFDSSGLRKTESSKSFKSYYMTEIVIG